MFCPSYSSLSLQFTFNHICGVCLCPRLKALGGAALCCAYA